MAKKITYQRFKIDVAASGQLVAGSFKLDQNTKLIASVAVESSLPNQAYYRGSQRLEISSDEIFPTGHETRRLMANQSVAQNDRQFDLGEVASGNKSLKIDYQDTNHPSAVFAAYSVTFIFKCIND